MTTPVELTAHARQRYRERIVDPRGTLKTKPSEADLAARMLADLRESNHGPQVDADLELWLMHWKQEHENVVFCLNYRTRSAFVVKRIPDPNSPHNPPQLVVLTCLKAVCKACGDVHGAGQCQKWNPSCYRHASIEPRQKRRDVSRAATQRKQDRRRYRESRSKSEQ